MAQAGCLVGNLMGKKSCLCARVLLFTITITANTFAGSDKSVNRKGTGQSLNRWSVVQSRQWM